MATKREKQTKKNNKTKTIKMREKPTRPRKRRQTKTANRREKQMRNKKIATRMRKVKVSKMAARNKVLIPISKTMK